MSTSSLPTVERTAVQIKNVISKDFAGVIKKRLDDVYKNAGASTTGPQREKLDKEHKATFIVSIWVRDLVKQTLTPYWRYISTTLIFRLLTWTDSSGIFLVLQLYLKTSWRLRHPT